MEQLLELVAMIVFEGARQADDTFHDFSLQPDLNRQSFVEPQVFAPELFLDDEISDHDLEAVFHRFVHFQPSQDLIIFEILPALHMRMIVARLIDRAHLDLRLEGLDLRGKVQKHCIFGIYFIIGRLLCLDVGKDIALLILG